MLTPAQILSSSRPTSDRMATLATRNAAKHTRAELERYAAVSSGWVRDMWLAALVLHRANAVSAPAIITDENVDAVIQRLSDSREGAVVLERLLDEIALSGDMDADLRRAVRHYIAQSEAR